MKILIVASWFPTPASPVNGIFVAEQAKALAVRHEISVLAPETAAAGRTAVCAMESVDGYRIMRTPIPAGNYVHAWRTTHAVLREIRSGRYDVVHAHVTLPGGFAAVLACLLARRPSVITEHMGPFRNLLGTRQDRIKVRFALKHASAVIAVSQGLRSQMQSHAAGRPILVVPNLVDIRTFRCLEPPRASGTRNLLFIGRLNDRQKNLPALLHAMASLNSGGSAYRLHIMGDGILRAEYEALARQLGIGASCTFTGFQPPERVAQALAECHLFVLPSLSENCPVVVAEALAAGRPAIVTRCGGSEEMVPPDCGAVVPVNDIGALAGAIAKICGNLDNYPPETIANYARNRFGAEVIVSRLTTIYESLLPRSRECRPAVHRKVA